MYYMYMSLESSSFLVCFLLDGVVNLGIEVLSRQLLRVKRSVETWCWNNNGAQMGHFCMFILLLGLL